MGLAIPALRYLVREHFRRPFNGPVLTLGRQCIYASLQDVYGLIYSEGLDPFPVKPGDVYTNIPSWQEEPYSGFTSDKAFWTALSDMEVVALDVSDYENPDIIWDMNSPIPEDLAGRFGLIIDGGTIEHVFDVRLALHNICRMLKPGGRIIHMSPASNYVDHGFYQFSPSFFFDYYGVNDFSNLRCQISDQGAGDVSFHDWSFRDWNVLRPEAAQSSNPLLIIFQAEKKECSTADRIPQQGDYRRRLSARCTDWNRRVAFGRILEAIRAKEISRVAVYGASENGRFLLQEIAGLGCSIDCLIDGNPALRGRQVDGFKVISLSDALERQSFDAIVIGSLASSKAIMTDIERAYQGRSKRPQVLSA
jgi:SAM-dependent methyltransferase